MPDQPTRPAHTQVPNLLVDWVLPLLKDGEARCLLYIVRHTVGFADANSSSGRKERDAISVDQFVNGITTGPAGGPRYLFDVGCGLRTADSVRRALEGLLQRKLVDVRYVCPKSLSTDGRRRCDWEQQPGDPPPPSGKGSKAPACPRCKRTCSRSWALADIRPKDIIALLNELDPANRQFTWDPELKRPAFSAPDAAPPVTHEELRDEALRLRGLLWHPKLVDYAITRTEAHHPKRKAISLTSRINNFYKPVLDLQETYVHAPGVVKYAIEQTIKNAVLERPPDQTRRWWRYAVKVAESNVRTFTGDGPAAGSIAAEEKRTSLPALERAMRDLLGRAADLNGRGDTESARALLSDIIAQAESLAGLFDGDAQRCETALREAFKQGTSDFVAIKPDKLGIAFDFYPEWTAPPGIL